MDVRTGVALLGKRRVLLFLVAAGLFHQAVRQVKKARVITDAAEPPRFGAEEIYTVVRLADDATVERACKLADIEVSDVDLVQRISEITPKNLPNSFRIVSFDGRQMTISERIQGERRVRGFAV